MLNYKIVLDYSNKENLEDSSMAYLRNKSSGSVVIPPNKMVNYQLLRRNPLLKSIEQPLYMDLFLIDLV